MRTASWGLRPRRLLRFAPPALRAPARHPPRASPSIEAPRGGLQGPQPRLTLSALPCLGGLQGFTLQPGPHGPPFGHQDPHKSRSGRPQAASLTTQAGSCGRRATTIRVFTHQEKPFSRKGGVEHVKTSPLPSCGVPLATIGAGFPECRRL